MRSISELSSLRGRRALVAGGAGHIGFAAAAGLAELGASVAILDRHLASCEDRARTLNAVRPDSALPVACDLSDEGATRACLRETVTAMGGLDVLIHCAAYAGSPDIQGWAVPFPEQSVDAWDAALRVNLTSAFVLAQEAAEPLRASGHGSIVLFSSIYGLVGPDMRLYTGTTMANAAGYSGAKGGLLQLTRYLSTVLAPAVRVNAVSPGGVLRGQPQSFQERYTERVPLGRMATEEDLKGAVAYLATDLSAYVTGQNLVVDGGWTAW